MQTETHSTKKQPRAVQQPADYAEQLLAMSERSAAKAGERTQNNNETFDVLDYAASVRHAILRSISHDEIPRTPVPAEGRDEMLDYLSQQNEIESIDSAQENDGTLDVWGEFNGKEFRVRFVVGESRNG